MTNPRLLGRSSKKMERYKLFLYVLPCLIFLLNGLFLRHWLLVFFSVLFAAAHIAITWQNTRAP